MTRAVPKSLTQAPRTPLTSIPEADVLSASHLPLDQEILASILPEIDAMHKHQFDMMWSQGFSHVEMMWKCHASRVEQMQARVAEFVEGGKKLEEESRALRQLMVEALSCLRTRHQDPKEQLASHSPPSSPASQVIVPPPGLTTEVARAVTPDGLRDSSSRYNSSLKSGEETSLLVTEANELEISLGKSDAYFTAFPSEAIVMQGDWTACDQNSNVKPVASFQLTLRRFENLPLGFQLRPDDDGEFLMVDQISSNCVVAAWNAQNVGEKREILRNDRITSVNGKRSGQDMRDELANARILKLIIERNEVVSSKTSSF